MAEVLDYRFRLRRGLAATWTSLNDVLLDGELGLERDTGRVKIGNGATPWNDLPYSFEWADAPEDGQVYGRKDGGWVIIDISGGSSGGGEILVTGEPGPVALTTNDGSDWLYTS